MESEKLVNFILNIRDLVENDRNLREQQNGEYVSENKCTDSFIDVLYPIYNMFFGTTEHETKDYNEISCIIDKMEKDRFNKKIKQINDLKYYCDKLSDILKQINLLLNDPDYSGLKSYSNKKIDNLEREYNDILGKLYKDSEKFILKNF